MKKERTRRPRPKIVVEPAFAAAAAETAEEFPFLEAAASDLPPTLPKKEKNRKKVTLVSPPPSTPPQTAKLGGDDEESSGEEAYKTPRKGTPEFNELSSTLVNVGKSLDKPGLSPEELTALRKEFKILNITVPPNTKQGGMVKKFYDHLTHLEKMGVNMYKVRERIGADIDSRGRGKERSAGGKSRARSHTVSPDAARKL